MSEKPSKEQYDAWTDDPANWKFKIFYFNKKDKRLLPPKRRRELGWTVNFANPKSIIALLGLMVGVIIIMRLLRSL